MSFFSFFKKKSKNQGNQVLEQKNNEKNFGQKNSSQTKQIVIKGIILSHDQVSGKTSVLRALSDQPFVHDLGPTTVDFSLMRLQQKNINIKLLIWDTSSHPSFKQIIGTYIKSLNQKKEKSLVILILPEFDSEFEKFKNYFLEKLPMLINTNLFIICETQVKWKVKGRTEVNRFVKSIFAEQIKFFKVFPQTGEGIKQMRSFIVNYFLSSQKPTRYNLKQSMTFAESVKKLNSDYFKEFSLTIAKKDSRSTQEKLQISQQICKIYESQLIKYGVNINDLLKSNNLLEEDEMNQQIQQIRQLGNYILNEQQQPDIKLEERQKQNDQINFQAQRESKIEGIERLSEVQSIGFSQIQMQFYEKIKNENVNLDALRNQLSGVYSDFNSKNEDQL